MGLFFQRQAIIIISTEISIVNKIVLFFSEKKIKEYQV